MGTTIGEDDLPYGLPEKLKDWDKITVSKEDAQDMATNGLPINYSGSGEGIPLQYAAAAEGKRLSLR